MKHAYTCMQCANATCIIPRVHENKSRQLHTMGSVTAEFEVRHRRRTATLFSGRCALTAEHVHACSLQKLDHFYWHFRLGLHFACTLTCSLKYSVQCLGSTLEDKCFSFFSTDWRCQWWRTSNSAVTAFIAKRPRVAYSCSHVLLIILICIKRTSSSHILQKLHTSCTMPVLA